MRKDVRFGLTIGAILLAVLVVYVLVVPGGDEPDLVTFDTLDPVITETEEATDTGPSILDQVTPVVTETPSFESTTPDNVPALTETPIAAVGAAEQFDWDAMLTHGRLIAVEQPRSNRQPAAQPINERATAPQNMAIPGDTGAHLPSQSTGGGTSSVAAQTYTVKSGDNFWTIAQAVYGDGRHYTRIEQANPGVNSNRLRVGQELRLPALSESATAAPTTVSRSAGSSALGARQYRVQQNDSLHRIAQKLYGDGSRWEEIYNLNRQAIGADPGKLKLDMVLQLPEEPSAVSSSR